MANRNFASGGKIYSMHVSPVLLDCNFVVDSTNGNGLGIRNLKGPAVANVFMHTTATPAPGNPNPAGGSSLPPGAPNLATAASFAILAYSAITGSTGAGSTITGNMGIYPNNLTTVTNFPPSTVIGTTHAADSAANQAVIDATAAFTAMNALTATAIPAVLDGQTLTPGTYKEASSTFSLAGSGNGTLTLNGPGVYIFQASSTLITGAGGIPSFAFAGGATPSNTYIYWAVGSSATINVGVSSAGATFYGTIIAQASITATQAGTITGRLFALTGAVTLSGTNALSLPVNPLSGGGVIVVQLADNYNRSLSGFSATASPVSGTTLTSTTAGTAYIITSLGTATPAQWVAAGLPPYTTPAVGAAFVAKATGTIGGSASVMTPAATGSGITSIETVGDPNSTISNSIANKGAQFILQCFSNGVKTTPADGTVISLAMLLSNSSIVVQGE